MNWFYWITTIFIQLFLLLRYTNGFNVVIDTQQTAVDRFISSLRDYFVQELNNSQIPTIMKDRRLGVINLTRIHMENVQIEVMKPSLFAGDYYMNIAHLRASLHGEYIHNVFFIHQHGDFSMRIADVNASIGPLIPVAHSGLPFIDSMLKCSISHCEDKVEVNGGILKHVAMQRLRKTMKSDLESILCDHLTGVLDSAIRKQITKLKLTSNVNKDVAINFLLSRPPLMLENNAIRTFHSGAIERNELFKFEPTSYNSSHDLVYHIHQNLFTSAMTAVCEEGNIDVFFPAQNQTAECVEADVSFSTLKEYQTVVLRLLYSFDDGDFEMKLAVTLLYSDSMVVSLRVKSRLLTGANTEIHEKIFKEVSKLLKTEFQLELPLPKDARIQRTNVELMEDRVVLFTDIVFQNNYYNKKI